jgi:hypothetical protein
MAGNGECGESRIRLSGAIEFHWLGEWNDGVFRALANPTSAGAFWIWSPADTGGPGVEGCVELAKVTPTGRACGVAMAGLKVSTSRCSFGGADAGLGVLGFVQGEELGIAKVKLWLGQKGAGSCGGGRCGGESVRVHTYREDENGQFSGLRRNF